MKHAWNTGAHYTPKGQRIAACVVDKTIVFNDIDRGIWGEFPIAQAPRDKFSLRDIVTVNYDHGNYDISTRQDALKELSVLASAI